MFYYIVFGTLLLICFGGAENSKWTGDEHEITYANVGLKNVRLHRIEEIAKIDPDTPIPDSDTTTPTVPDITTPTDTDTSTPKDTDTSTSTDPDTPTPTLPPILSPEEQILQVIEDLHELLNKTTPILINDVELVFDQVDKILNFDEDTVYPGELTQLLKELGAKVDLDGVDTAIIVRDNVALLIADSTIEMALDGIAIAKMDSDNNILTKESLYFMFGSDNSNAFYRDVNEMAVFLPLPVMNETHRISFNVYRDARAFKNEDEEYISHGPVAAIYVENFPNPANLVAVFALPWPVNENNLKEGCAYWSVLPDGTGFWSEEGCTFIKLALTPQYLDMCMCHYFTHVSGVLIRDMTEPTTLSPEDQIEQIVDDIKQLLQNDTAIIFVDDISEIIDQVNTVLGYGELVFSGELLKLLDELGARVNLNGSPTGVVENHNIALLMADSTPENHVIGIAVANRDTFESDSFTFFSEFDSDYLNANNNDVVLHLPLSITREPRRLSFVVFRDGSAFSYDGEDVYGVNSHVISINVGNDIELEEGEVVDIYFKPVTAEPNDNLERSCAHWQFKDDLTGYWSEEGCTLVISPESGILDNCRCDHFTHFAEVLRSSAGRNSFVSLLLLCSVLIYKVLK